ncbi:MAG TPA: hypothetical protein VFT74_19500 [Isosphaeraceae bacterium]|nr:hypothetical protein [Isosphaeraceae bacterium]
MRRKSSAPAPQEKKAETSAAKPAPTGLPPAKPPWWSASVRAWLARPVGILLTFGLIALLLVLPAWLFWDQLINFRLRNDDFNYLIGCRSGAQPLANLWKPHNTHIVPLFRLLTGVSAVLAGSPAGLQSALLLANYLGLILMMLGVGFVVARESRSAGCGLAAMVLVGLTTVNDSAATWYSAGQTLWAADFVLLALALFQDWRIRPHPASYIAGLIACAAAPFIWTGGLMAGIAGSVYLGQSGRRKSALMAFLVSVAVASVILILAQDAIASASQKADDVTRSFSPVIGLIYTIQAIPESVILGNLCLDTQLTAPQAAVLMLLLLVWWAWSRRSLWPGPLEAAGFVVALGAYGMAFTLRSGYSFYGLRVVGWYDTMPLVGMVLFFLGWWSRLGGPSSPGWPNRLRRGEALCVVGIIGAALVLHVPRAQSLLISDVPPLLPSEQKSIPIPSLQRLRSLYIQEDLCSRQQRALIRLGQAAEISRRLGISRTAIRDALGRVEVPGWPEAITEYDALDLLVFPETGTESDPALIRKTLGLLLLPEPITRPPWINPDEPWPPPIRGWQPDSDKDKEDAHSEAG